MQNDEIHQLKQRFTQLFGEGGKIRVVRAPGRVNLIGEHTDYNDGFVFPMAIEPEIRVVFRGRSDETIKIASSVYSNEFVEFSLQKKIERTSPPGATMPAASPPSSSGRESPSRGWTP